MDSFIFEILEINNPKLEDSCYPLELEKKLVAQINPEFGYNLLITKKISINGIIYNRAEEVVADNKAPSVSSVYKRVKRKSPRFKDWKYVNPFLKHALQNFTWREKFSLEYNQ